MRVHGRELGRIEAAESTASFDMPMFKAQLANQPHDLLQVEGTAPSPDRQHLDTALPWRTPPRGDDAAQTSRPRFA